MNTPGLRYAALKLAGLHPADRAWLLERLPVAEADALRALGATPGLANLARLADDIEPPVATTPSVPVVPAVARLPLVNIDGLDPLWASLWLRAGKADVLEHYLADTTPERAAAIASSVEAMGPSLPGKLAASLARWTPAMEADA